MHRSHLQNRELCFSSLRVENWNKFFYMGDLFLLLHLFIYSITLFYQYWLVDIYIILRAVIQCYITSLLKLFNLWPIRALSAGSCVSVTLPHNYECFLFCCCFWHYRMSQDHLVYFLPQSYNQLISHFSKEICFFFLYWRIALEIKIWALDIFIATLVLLALSPLSWQYKEICVYTSPCIYTVNISICHHLYQY